MFDVKTVMQSIKNEIQERDSSISEKYLAKPYYERRIKECREKRDIVIFGSGINGQKLYHMLLKENIYTIRCFCDNSKEKQGKKIEDIYIYSAEETLEYYPCAYFLITASGYENEIIRQLIKLGVSMDNIAVFITKFCGWVM